MTRRTWRLAFLLAGGVACSGGGGGGGGLTDDAVPSLPALPPAAVEEPAIRKVTADLAAALGAGDVDAASALFAPQVRARQRAWFEAHSALLPLLAPALSTVTVSQLSDENGWQEGGTRFAEVRFEADAKTFFLQLEKVDGLWTIRTF